MLAIRRLAIVLALVIGCATGATGVARAADIPRLTGPVTDQTGVLDGRIAEVEDAVGDLLAGHNVQLFVLFVPTTDELSVTDFADQTAGRNSLGVNDALLLVAIEDRTDAIWLADGLTSITDRELDEIISGTLEPRLANRDFAGAVVATAEALGLAASATPQPTTAPQPTEGPDAGGAGGIGGGPLVGIVLLALGLVILGLWLAGRLSRALATRREAEERDRRTGRLAREANALLIATDERTRQADQEAGFVEAEFGEEQAAPFREAIVTAREELRAAFEIRQRLDDSEPEDPPTRERMLAEIVERCGRAGAALDAQAERIRELRDMERNAGSILAALPGQLAAEEARLAPAETTLGGLRGFAPETWKPVDGNLEEARKGLEGARQAIRRASASPAPTGRALVHDLLLAQEGIAGARALIDAVESQARSVHDADDALAGELRAAEADLAAARATLADQPGARVPADGPSLEAAEQALRAARQAAGAAPRDPVTSHRFAVDARRDAAAVLAAARGAAAERARVFAALDSAIRTAAADVQRAADFIATRRSGVGRQARTRLAEAERLLDRAAANREADPKAAIADAQRAERLAEEAYSLAAGDFGRWDAGGPSPAGGGVDLGSVILGTILGNVLSGGGRGGGWGGSSWGSPGRPGGSRPSGGNIGWGGGGRSRGGSFGGFGGGGRAGGGGGFGGGGGRSRGGRW